MHKPILVTFLLAAACAHAQERVDIWQPSPGHVQVPIWPGAAPDAMPNPKPESVGPPAGRDWWPRANDVSMPTMTMYAPKGRNTGVAVVVFPGGGYQFLAMDLEGTEICDWLTSRGITCVLLKYRVPDSGPTVKDGRAFYPKVQTALQDAQRTIGLVRQHAPEWHVDGHKVGVIGFSAGGHLVTAISNATGRSYKPVDAADRLSARPDFAMPIYPGHLWSGHGIDLFAFDPVRADAPPTFIVQAEDDPVDDVRNSISYFLALKAAKVPVEMHIYAHGGHAFGLRPTDQPITRWPALAETWLHTIGML
jgi:acetyl esterase/lipase